MPVPMLVASAEGAEILHAGLRVPQERMVGAGRGVAESRHLAAGVDALLKLEVPPRVPRSVMV